MRAILQNPEGWRRLRYGEEIKRSHRRFDLAIGGRTSWVKPSILMIGEEYYGRGIYICKTKGKK